MTNQEKIRYLNQYKKIVRELENLFEKHEYFKSKFESIAAPIMSDMPRMTNYAKDKMDKGLILKEQFEEQIGDKIFELFDKKIELFNIINSLDESVHRELMRLRYMDGYKWEEIAVEMNYSWQRIHQLHNDALENIRVN